MDTTCVDSFGNSVQVEKYGVTNSELVEYDKMKEPCVGMMFGSFEEARTFYEEYGQQKGYAIRIRSTYRDRRGPEVSSALFVCTCEGFNQKMPSNDDSGKIKRSSSLLRTGCKACMRVTNVRGTTTWKVTIFSDQHNHKLFTQSEKDVMKYNKRKPRTPNKNLTEAMRISMFCQRSTQLAYMAGKSEEIYKVIMSDMEETLKKVSQMGKVLLKNENDGSPSETNESIEQPILVDPLISQTKGKKRLGKEKISGTGIWENGLEVTVAKFPKPRKNFFSGDHGHDSPNFQQWERKLNDNEPGISFVS